MAWLFGLSAPTFWGPFATVQLDHDSHIPFAEPVTETVQMQHLAFLVDDQRFDEISGRMLTNRLERWADPQMKVPGQINTNQGGQGVYFKDAAGHGL